MKKSLSLKTVIILAFVCLSSLLMIGYSILSARFFSHGVARVIMDNMDITVDNHHRSVSKNKRTPVAYWGNYRITTQWKYMPEPVKQSFPVPVPPSKQLYIATTSGLWSKSGPNYYVRAIRKGEDIYYISQWIGFSTPPGIFGWNSYGNIRFLIVLSCMIGMGIAIVLWLIIRQVSQPMVALNHWAKNLDSKQIAAPIPDFSFKELNGLASLLREKIAAEQENLDRDQQFLHYASHELRTPVTIIRQNVEVLKKVAPLNTDQARTMEKNAVKRLGRASDNMATLMETLLWLGRKETCDLPLEDIRIDHLIHELIDSLSFLLKGRPVQVTTHTCPAVFRVAQAPLRIVLSNLIRNAFIHTPEGTVAVCQSPEEITIVNHRVPGSRSSALGFGFGLNLTSKLMEKMNWSYENQAGPDRHKVVIRVCS